MLEDPRLPSQARIALACLDLTSLNDADCEADVAALCARAQGPCGPVAAVCVWPRFAGLARSLLPAHIAVAAVANFPDGSAAVDRALRETDTIVRAGAQEVDLVLPWKSLLAGDEAAVTRLLRAARGACAGQTLKVILESGELRSSALIAHAARLALDAGADFIKTSTGKTAVSATPEAARTMLGAIAAHPQAAQRAGFKASGGIRNVVEAGTYMALVRSLLGPQALTSARFRIGASSLLNDLEAVLRGAGARPEGPGPAGSRY